MFGTGPIGPGLIDPPAGTHREDLKLGVNSVSNWVRIMAAVLACAWLALPVAAQTRDLPENIVTSTESLSGDRLNTVREYASAALRDLRSDRASTRREARARLLRPLTVDGVSVTFRLGYGRELVPALREMARESEETIAYNALVIAGELATDQASEVLVEHIDDERQAIRYGAAFGLARTFDAVANRAPAITRDQIRRLISLLGERIREEQEPWVMDGVVRALIAAGAISSGTFEEVRPRAYSELAQGIGSRVRALRDADEIDDTADTVLISALRTGEAIRDLWLRDARLPRDAALATVALSADVLSFVDQASGWDLSEEHRRMLLQLTSVSENVIFFARDSLDPDAGARPTQMAEMLRDGHRNRMREELRRMIGSGGTLTREPFNFPDNRFLSE